MSALKRRKFLKVLSATSLLGVVGEYAFAGEVGTFTLLTKPYLQHPTSDGMTICWITNKPAHSWVEYWEGTDSKKVTKSQMIIDGLATAYNTVNKIRLTGLTPGSIYGYRVVSKEIKDFQPYKKVFGETVQSADYTFRTVGLKSEKSSLLILNDIHDRPRSFEELTGLVGAGTYDEVFLNGDMFDYQTGQQQLIDHLIAPCTSVFASEKPFLFVRGNHETRGVFTYRLKDYFENIDNQAYFSFSRGPVFFMALDTGEDKEDNHEAYSGMAAFDPFREQQAKWLEAQLDSPAAKSALYRVVLMHIPPYHSGDWHGPMHCRQVFAPIFERKRIDLVVSGHTHRYGVHLAQADHSYPIVIGGGPKDGNRTVMMLQADKKELKLSMLLDTGAQVGEVTIRPRKI